MPVDILKVIAPTVLTFFIGIFITPFFTRYFYKYKMWKKSPRSDSDTSDEFGKIHNTEHEVSTPRVGGVIIWVSVFLTVAIIFLLSRLYPEGLFGGRQSIFDQINFFSRSQTVVPLGAFFLAAIIGLFDDLLQIFGKGTYAKDPLIYRKVKIVFVTLIGISIALWFYYKLDFVSIMVPFWGPWFVGAWFIPIFVIVMLGTFSGSVIDGLDGLSGGVLASCFSAYSAIAFLGSQYDISALSGAIAGGILAFLWFNVPPARFYMGESGMLALTVVLSVIAFLTDAVLLLPIIALPLVATVLSDVIQIGGYKYFDKKRVFLIAPLHHHFQALGWPREKVVMRYWIVSVVCAITGVILYVISY
jgi:phospho-N-acetylmuramoyl-pentapeptide-transferase